MSHCLSVAWLIDPVLLKISIAPECLKEYNVCPCSSMLRLSLKTTPKGLKIVLI